MHKCDSLYYYSTANLFYADRQRMDQLIAEDRMGLKLFRDMFTRWIENVCWHDRSHAITTPFRSVTMPGMELPQHRTIGDSMEDICQARASQLLEQARNSGKQLLVMYSGGIDSTLMLVSFMKAAAPKQLKRQLLVLMNNNSINENPSFYRDHIIHKCSIGHSQFFHSYIGDPRFIVVTGECNDQLWGSQQLSYSNHIFTDQPWDVPMQDELVIRWFADRYSTDTAERIFSVLKQIGDACPFSLDSVYAWFWYVMFVCKWQQNFLRGVAFAHPSQRANFVPHENWTAFYSTEPFQLWSMTHRHDLRHDKWLCKQIIYDYNGDSDYRDRKLKQGSLGWLLRKKASAAAIDSDLGWHDTWTNDGWFNPDNSFSRA